ncbi:DNA repair protein RecO [Halopseudomonas sabulinigri]|uniref:DNA repair protein RecO n=1 Tax=Halopseudomonas sabulinigri TaxID=472181 RepID=A0ABP9ZRA7_9GAMM
MSLDLQPAYVLHSRPYRDSSALVDLLTLREGMQRVVWRGARRGRGVKPQPFTPLLLNLYGRGELKTLQQAEVAGSHVRLQGEALFSGLYLNELLVRLLSTGDPQTLLFAAYQTALEQLASERAVEPVLREFEWQLLELLGYGFSLEVDAEGAPLQPQGLYHWDAEQGLSRTEQSQPGLLPGSGLLAMASGDWQHAAALHTAKRLMRKALAVHLGDRPLVSRQLFAAKP